MTIGLPIALSFQSSNVEDKAVTLEELLQDCQSPIFTKGLELQSDEWVFEYVNDINYVPKTWNQADEDAGLYDLDEVLFKNCKLIKVTGKSGTGITTHQRPKEPEEYGAWDAGVDPTAFSYRYMRVSNASTNGWLNRTWYSASGGIWYYMFWEARGFGGCGTGAWRWSAKDVDHEDPRGIEDYLRTCLINTYSTKFDAAKDIKAEVIYWGSPNRSKENTLQFKSIIERGGYFYYRTHLNIPIQYATWTEGTEFQYSYMEVISPADIDGFIQKRRTNAHNPFDGKNYTKAVVDTSLTEGVATWSMLATEDFDSVAFGGLVCDSIDLKVMDLDGVVQFQLNNYIVDNSVAINSDIDYNSTRILYTKEMMNSEWVIEVTLHGATVEIGEIIGAKSIDAGFSKATFQNKFKDFSPKEQDQWGNWYYIEGVKVHVHSGTVLFKILRYDQLNRLMVLIGGKKMVINGSDSLDNEVPDGEKIFDATMMIGRFTRFELDSAEKNKRLGTKGEYIFEVEELV